jgi:hypothetical protein
MSTVRQLRSAFTPEGLATLDHTLDEVWNELLEERVLSPLGRDASEVRTQLARKLIGFASSGWSAIQIKQLLLRTLHNERLAAWYRGSQHDVTAASCRGNRSV